jgi:hypothetical protein
MKAWSQERGRTISAGEAVGKKVTFRSPAPTTATSVLRDDAVATGGRAEGSELPGNGVPLNSPTKASGKSARSIIPDLRSRPASRNSLSGPVRPVTTRKSSLPPLSAIRPPSSSHSQSQPSSTSPTKSSTLSPTPSDSSTALSTRSYLPPPNSWSEMAEEDLIANLGPRERTRQEVLWEIVSSEERSVEAVSCFATEHCFLHMKSEDPLILSQIRAGTHQTQRHLLPLSPPTIVDLTFAQPIRPKPFPHPHPYLISNVPDLPRRVACSPGPPADCFEVRLLAIQFPSTVQRFWLLNTGRRREAWPAAFCRSQAERVQHSHQRPTVGEWGYHVQNEQRNA